MRVILANHGFVNAGGTEAYVLILAEHLQRLGHEVFIYAHELGPYADHARGCGVDVVGQLSGLPDECDLVLSQDAVVAYELAERLPEALHVFRACSDLFDFELPPQFDDVVDLVVVLSDRYERLVRACAVSAPIVRLRIPVDLDRLGLQGSIREVPRKVVVLGNYADRHDVLWRAWEGAGLELTVVGGAAQSFDIGAALADADIVVAKSRSAVEAMGCGRAVYIYDMFGGDGWVTPANYPLLEADNFAGQATDRVITEADVVGDLASYDRGMGMVNRDLVLQHHGARDHALEFLAALGERRPGPRPTVQLREFARLTALQWSWERITRHYQHQHAALHERVARAEDAAAQAARAAADADGERAELVARSQDAIAEATAARDRAEVHARDADTRAAEADARAAACEERAAEAHARVEAMRSTRAWRLASGYWRLRERARLRGDRGA